MEEVLEGWLFIFRDRLIVTVLIAAAISVTALVRTESLRLRAVLLAVGVLVGAVSGELIVRRLHGKFDGIGSLTAHSLRWSAVALAVSATFYLWRVSSTTPTGGSASQNSIRRFPRFLASRACPHRAETPSLGTRSAVVAGASAPLHEFDRPLLVLGLPEVESRQRGCVDLIDGVLDSFRLALEHFCRHQRRRAQAAHVPR